MSEMMSELPYIDPNIEHLGVSQLRQMDGKSIRSKNGKALLIQDHNEPIAVLLSYEQYLVLQEKMKAVMNTMEMFTDDDEAKLFLSAMSDFSKGKTRSLGDIRAELGADPQR
jgi:hypothetical protein